MNNDRLDVKSRCCTPRWPGCSGLLEDPSGAGVSIIVREGNNGLMSEPGGKAKEQSVASDHDARGNAVPTGTPGTRFRAFVMGDRDRVYGVASGRPGTFRGVARNLLLRVAARFRQIARPLFFILAGAAVIVGVLIANDAAREIVLVAGLLCGLLVSVPILLILLDSWRVMLVGIWQIRFARPAAAFDPAAVAWRKLVIQLTELEDLERRALRVSHPLLADEIGEMVDIWSSAITDLMVAAEDFPRPDEVRILDRHAVSSLKKRVRRAWLAYCLNLPLARENAANFAVVRMSDRIERLTSLIAPRLETFRYNDGRDGNHV